MNHSLLRIITLISGLLLASNLYAKAEYTLKFATLAPAGTTWMNLLEEWAQTVKTQSNGRLVFKFYPGGVQGDEPDVLKKMRFNQLQGSAFSGHGIGQIYSPARVMELPFLFDTFDEIDHVRNQLMPEFEQGFHDNGYELLGWMEIGFVHMFSKEPIHSIKEMKSHRVWLWQGDPLGKAFFDASGVSPVPLSIIDVYTSLSTGLIDTVYSTPLATIAMQWHTKTRYVSDIALTNAIGGLIVTRTFFDKLPADLKILLQTTGKETGEKLIAATREDNDKSVAELKKRGLTFIPPGDGMSKPELLLIRDKAAAELMRSNYIPKSLFDRTSQMLQKFRSTQSSAKAIMAN